MNTVQVGKSNQHAKKIWDIGFYQGYAGKDHRLQRVYQETDKFSNIFEKAIGVSAFKVESSCIYYKSDRFAENYNFLKKAWAREVPRVDFLDIAKSRFPRLDTKFIDIIYSALR